MSRPYCPGFMQPSSEPSAARGGPSRVGICPECGQEKRVVPLDRGAVRFAMAAHYPRPEGQK